MSLTIASVGFSILGSATAEEVLTTPPVINMRVGASDARHYRHFQIPSVIFGPTSFNMGGPDEHVLIDELLAVAKVHTLAAFDFLIKDR